MFHRSAITLGLALLLAVPGAASDSPDEALDLLATSLKGVNKSDDEVRDESVQNVVATIDVLTGSFADFDDKQKKEVIKGISKVFSTRTHDRGGDTSGDKIYMAAAAAFSEMGPDAEKMLKKAMKTKHLEKKIDVQELIIEAIGNHKNEKNIDMFIKLLVDDDAKIVRAAVNALGQYHESDAKVRKKVAEGLVKQYANTHSLDLREKGRNPVWRERLTTIEVPMNEALAKLTLQSFQSAPDWEKWYNDNRSKRW